MIRLFWYEIPNFGDMLSPYIVKSLSGDNVSFYNPLSFKRVFRNYVSAIKCLLRGRTSIAKRQILFTRKPVLIAVGSLLEHSTTHCVCWGTGMAQKMKIPSGGKFVMTRGFLSKAVLEDAGYKVESETCGDPALLMPLLIRPDVKPIPNRIGVIPHISEIDEVKEYLKNENDKVIIDFRTKEYKPTIKKLLECSFVYSSSLHGIILCHAYGIPCLWFQYHVFAGGDFKFNDHFSAVGITPYKPLDIEDIKRNKRLDDKYEAVPRNTINMIQKELIKNAPFTITAKI